MSNNRSSKIISVTLALLLVFASVPSFSVFAANIASGTCGSNAVWKYDSQTATLTISGTGIIKDYTRKYNTNVSNNDSGYYTTAPWWNYYNLTEHLVIEDGITTIGNWCFYSFRNVKTVALPNTLKTIKYCAFHCFSGSFEEIVFPKGLQQIGEYAFDGSDVTRIVVPGSVKTVPYGAFHYCGNLKEVIIERGCTRIDSCAFNNCFTLSKITIPSTVNNIGSYALCRQNPPNGWWAYSGYKGLCIYGENNSYVKQYANNNNIAFIALSYINSDLYYPIFEENTFAHLLKTWADSSEYSSAFNDFINEGYTYNELLYKTIDVPIKDNAENIYSVGGTTNVKDLMAYIIFADIAQDYLIKSLNKVRSSFQNNKSSEAYQNFFNDIKNFQTQYYYFQKDLNGEDDFQQTLYALLLAKTVLTVVDNSGIKDVKYAFDLYKGSLSESPQYYDDLYYYVMSGGDTKYLNSSYTDTMNGLGLAVKDSGQLINIIKNGFSSGEATSYVTFGLDNLSYFAEKYGWDYKNKIKKAKEIWEWADTTIEYANAIATYSVAGTLSATWKLSKEYIDEVKKIYTAAESIDAGWYALTYFYLMGNNKNLLNALIDQNTGSAEFGIDRIVQYGIPYNHNSIIENNIVKYWNKKAYLTYAYTPDKDMRLYLWKACDTANSIMEMDINDYCDMLLQYLVAEINLQKGIAGIDQGVSVVANDNDLGNVTGSGQYRLGSSVTVTANPYINVAFQGWKNIKTNEIVSTLKQYTFEVNGEVSLQAVFVAENAETASTPNISMISSDKSYYCGVAASDLSVSASSNDNGVVSVKWYKTDTNRNYGGSYVGSGSSFTPDTSDVGTNYYYAVATNTLNYQIGTKTITTDAAASSRAVKITVLNPVITSINIGNNSIKQRYFKGREIIYKDMSLVAVFSNGDSEIINDGYELQNCDTSSTGIKNIAVSWLGKTANIQIEIVEPNATHLSNAVNILLSIEEKDNLYDMNEDDNVDILDLIVLKKQLANIV